MKINKRVVNNSPPYFAMLLLTEMALNLKFNIGTTLIPHYLFNVQLALTSARMLYSILFGYAEELRKTSNDSFLFSQASR